MIDMLKSIGIEKGKPFNPDAKTQDILKQPRAKPTPGWISSYEGIFTPSYFNEGSQWALPALPEYLEGIA